MHIFRPYYAILRALLKKNSLSRDEASQRARFVEIGFLAEPTQPSFGFQSSPRVD